MIYIIGYVLKIKKPNEEFLVNETYQIDCIKPQIVNDKNILLYTFTNTQIQKIVTKIFNSISEAEIFISRLSNELESYRQAKENIDKNNSL